MPSLLEKKITSKLYESDKSIIYRAFDNITEQEVILKILKTDCQDAKESARYKNEYETIRYLDLENVITAYSLERYNGSYILILEDIQATSLNRLYANRELTLDEFFDISIKIVKSLGNIHGKNIIHKNLNPTNIIYNSLSKVVKIIDFGIAAYPLIDIATSHEAPDIESNVAYISPEQTGKMDCFVDFRSDFYSLGITFYELLGGTLPFKNSDPIGMVHSHFAIQPKELYKMNSKIPISVSNIVMKLIEKNPDNRYQNCLSIIDDLTQCYYHLKPTAKRYKPSICSPPSFSKKLNISELLFGRSNEIDKLSSLFDKVLEGQKKIAFATGNAGVGKTALIMEFYKKIVLGKAYFISSKFDQIRQDIHYGAIVEVLSQLIQQVLMEKEPIFKQYQNNLRRNLGNNGQLMIDLLPEIEHIIGPQNPVIELPVVEAQNRFNYVFHNFIRGFLNIKRPIVFFLDDLQWADASSLDFLKMILFEEDIDCIFFIGAFRENEVDSNHPWQKVLDNLTENGYESERINLKPLNFQDVNQFVSESLQCSLKRGHRISELVEKRTAGNPFFIKEFLKLIYEKKLLEFDPSTTSWRWKLRLIEKMDGTDPIVTLVEDKLLNIRPDTMNLIKMAACLGNSFYIDSLSLICGLSVNQVLLLLDEAVRQGIIIHIKDVHNHSPKKALKQLKVPKECKFLHDRFLKAAYSLIEKKDRSDLHWKIGNLLLKTKPSRENREGLLEIVNHLNLGRNSITSESEKYKLAQANLLAAKKTKRASAYQAAFSYLEIGISIFCPAVKEEKGSISPWDKNYDLCLSLYEKAVEMAFLTSRYEQMENLAGIIDKKARTITDKVKNNEVRIRSLYARNRMSEAIDLGLSFSRELGERLSKNPTKMDILVELFKTKLLLKGKNVEQLANLPEMINPQKLAVLKILSSLVLPAFYASPNLVPLIVFKGLCLSIKYGNTEESLFGYAGYGLILCGLTGDIHTGFQFGELAQTLLDKLHAGRIRARTMATIHAFIRHWKVHIRETLPPLLEAHQSGLEFGDHQYAAISAKSYCSRELFAGISLEKVAQDTKLFTELTIKLNQDVVLNSMLILSQMVDTLTGESEHPWLLEGNSFSYEKMFPLLEQSDDQMGMFTATLMHLILCFLFGKYDLAVELLPRIRKYLSVARAMPDRAFFIFFESLSILGFLQTPEAGDKKKYLRQVKKNQAQMKKWSLFAPMNFEQLYYLVEAERSNFNKDSSNAKKYYDLAVKHSNQNDYINCEALANELAGKFHLKQQDLETAKDCIIAAHYSYMRWGAFRKSTDLEKRYGLFIPQYSSLTMRAGYQNMDVYAILKASQAISKTMEFDRLMTELVRVVIEYSGAQKACILLYSDKVLKIEAIAKTDPEKIEFFNSRAVDEKNTEFPLSILYYSIRSRQSVILKDASQKNKFTSDPYLMENKPFSILCKPLVNKNTVIGILYLENNLLKGAFSEEHISLLDVFISQILISIENSKLYEALVREIEKKDKAVKEIKAKQELLQNISAELVAAEERERKTIAEDLHDSVSQSLAYSISRLKSLNLSDLHSTADQLLEILTFLTQAANNIRSLTFQLSPPLLKDLGFEDSLEWLCEDLFTRYGLKILFKNRLPEPVYLDETVKLNLYRVVRELAMNIVKHARVKTAELNVFLENNYFVVVLEDKGAGFDVQSSLEKSQKFGLFSIYRRMEAIDGAIEISSEKTKGTKVTIKMAAFS